MAKDRKWEAIAWGTVGCSIFAWLSIWAGMDEYMDGKKEIARIELEKARIAAGYVVQKQDVVGDTLREEYSERKG